jgi:hypothetical protein
VAFSIVCHPKVPFVLKLKFTFALLGLLLVSLVEVFGLCLLLSARPRPFIVNLNPMFLTVIASTR